MRGCKEFTLFMTSLLCVTSLAVAKSTSMHFVPSDANPGHIVTKMSQSEGQRSSVHSAANDATVGKYFTVLQQGSVITTGNVTSLKGQTISLTILHELFGEEWTEQLTLHVANSVPKMHFVNSPYSGYISENQPIGSDIQGLEDLSQSFAHFPYGCLLSLDSGDMEYFKLGLSPMNGVRLMSNVVFNREVEQAFYVTLKAHCAEGLEAYARVAVKIVDVNDEVPVFERASYGIDLDRNSVVKGVPFFQVKASDADAMDIITYSMRHEGAEPFRISPENGDLYIAQEPPFEDRVYTVVVYATDLADHRSDPATLQINVFTGASGHDGEISKQRYRRQATSVRDERGFVVNRNDAAPVDLFSVASMPRVAAERFSFEAPAPEGLALDEVSGLVRREAGHTWQGDVVSFNVLVNDSSAGDYTTLTVNVFVVDRTWTSPVFTTQPQPLVTSVPMWIRPDMTVLTLQAVDQSFQGCDVRYMMETGGSGRFYIDHMTGEVKVADRGQFFDNQLFELAISAQCLGTAAALSRHTPSQLVLVEVEDVNPQFYYDPYIINVEETTSANTDVATIEVKSFQDLDIDFTVVWDDPQDADTFAIDLETGEVRLRRDLTYITDKQQYRATVTATEERSLLASTKEIIINLTPENLHTPVFPPDVYVAADISEAVGTDFDILELFAIDLDPGNLGLMTFTTTDEHFRVDSEDGKNGILRPNSELDYDFLGPEHKYEFLVYATDQDPDNPKSSSVTVQVFMQNVDDDEPPVLWPANPRIWLKEGATAGTLIHVVQAFDPDGGIVSFGFRSGPLCAGLFTTNRCDIFELDQNTGHITLNAVVPAGKTDGRLLLLLRDTSGATTEAEIKVEFVGVNHPPQFLECSSYQSAFINEGEAPDTPVLNITVDDEDSGSNGEIKFSVIPNPQGTYFSIIQVGEKTGQLVALESFNRDNRLGGAALVDGDVKYKVNVLAEDQGRPPLSTTCFFFVTVRDINNKAPIFDETVRYEATIFDSTPIGTEIMRVWAIDDDQGENGRVTYSLADPNNQCPGCFRIDEESGWIQIDGTISEEIRQVTLNATATDHGLNPKSSSIDVIITLTDERGDEPPQWQQIEGSSIDDYAMIEVLENAAINEAVIDVTALVEGGESIQYSLARGRTRQENSDRDFYFTAEENVMRIHVATNNLAYEEVPEYLLKLRASRQRSTAQPYTDARLMVKIVDVNDKVPQFEGLDSRGRYSTAVSDKTERGEFILNVVAIDLDGTSPNNKVTYSFHEDCGEDTCGHFTIDADTGDIRAARENYYRQERADYLLKVEARDGAPSANREDGQHNKATANVAITVLGPSLNPPAFERSQYRIDVVEGRPLMTKIGNVTANDPDPDANYPQYLISNGQTSTTRSPFSVNGSTGDIYLTAQLLYAEQQTYTLDYSVFDGSDDVSTSVEIHVTPINIQAPVFGSTVYEVAEGRVREHDNTISASSPRLLTTVQATDDDSSQITYRAEGRFKEFFSVDENGNVYLLEPLDRDYPVGYENWQINVVATDTPGSSASRDGYAILNLRMEDVNDNQPKWDITTIEGSVIENSLAGTDVMQLVAGDVDAGDNGNVEYVLYNSPINDDGEALFSMGADGLVEVAVSYSMDRERLDHYELLVGAHDLGDPRRHADNQTIYVMITDENDHQPIFTQPSYEFSMPEAIPVGGSVYDVTAMDKDIGENAKLTFSIPGTGDGDAFYFDSIYVAKTGALKVKTPVDYEEMTEHQLSFTIQVEDASNSRTADVIINVYDVNDNAPQFSPETYEVSFSEDTDPGRTVATLAASDRDSGINQEFYYMIDHEHTDRDYRFALEPPDGNAPEAVVVLRQEVDREVQGRYELHVLAVDKGEPAMTGTATLTVVIEDVNDHAPDFAEGEGHYVVTELTRSGTEVARFYGNDLDSDANGPPFTFQLECNAAFCSDFTFETQTDAEGNMMGIVRAARNGYSRAQLGFDQYRLPIRMTDTPSSGAQARSALRTLVIDVQSSGNNYRMQPGDKRVVVYTYMGEFNDVPCGSVYVEDEDVNDLDDKTFKCVDGCRGPGFTYFSVNEEDGQVFMKRGVPPGEHKIEVEVTESKWPVTVISKVMVKVIYIDGEALEKAGSVRLSGTTAEDFISGQSEMFRKKVAELLNTDANNVDVFAVQDAPSVPPAPGAEATPMVDVTFAAHGSPYYSPARLNGVVMANAAGMASAVDGVSVDTSPVNLCLQEVCFGVPCRTVKKTYLEPALTNAGSASFAGINTTYEAVCEERMPSVLAEQPLECGAASCLNGGGCVQNHHGWTCDCLPGFDGPRCQNTKISFQDNSWGWFDPIDQMVNGRISFSFATKRLSGVLLYNGPTAPPGQQGGVSDFIAVFLERGIAKARIDLGAGTVNLAVDGTGSPRLNDGRWHSLEIIKQNKLLRLVVDHCASAVVDEEINSTSEERSSCESSAVTPGDNFLLNVLTPLELGGRSAPNRGPDGLPGNGDFEGCIKDLRVNDKLYDLNVDYTQHEGLSNGCASEGCSANGEARCPQNSTCMGNLNNDDVTCVCDLGWRGEQCDQETRELDFAGDDSFIEWELKSDFNESLSTYDLSIAAMFITRDQNGMIFTASSFSRLEHIKVDILDTHPRLRYDLGAGERDLVLSHVNASDGVWHKVYVGRHGNQLWLALDQAEGVLYGEVLPVEDEHRLLAVHDARQTFGGAEVVYRKYHENNPTVSHVLASSCVSDIRVSDKWLPLAASENAASPAAEMERAVDTQGSCESDGCAGVVCPDVQLCRDYWRMPFCVCPAGLTWRNAACVPLTDCSIARCSGHGLCVVPDGAWYCHCDKGWSGKDCSVKEGDTGGQGGGGATLSTGSIAAIVVCILVLLLLILVVLFFIMRRKKAEEDPDDEIRENIVCYDEEGGGEEDMHAYDLSRLQKPVMEEPGVVAAYAPRQDVAPPVTSGAPEPMSAPRKFNPADYPDIGDFIGDRLKDADYDPNLPPYDSVREYEYEGGGSSAGSLSSLQTSSSGDLDFSYLNDFGPRFQKLADIYGVGQEDDDNSSV